MKYTPVNQSRDLKKTLLYSVLSDSKTYAAKLRTVNTVLKWMLTRTGPQTESKQFPKQSFETFHSDPPVVSGAQ